MEDRVLCASKMILVLVVYVNDFLNTVAAVEVDEDDMYDDEVD